MSSYRELIKNFERIRAYMREFYVYGFKSRDDYSKKSARSYDDERRRMESWLGDHMSFVRTAEGKNVFISIDSRTSLHNPFYKAWKSKSFTDGDITLHFILFDIFHDDTCVLTLPEILSLIDEKYLSSFEAPLMFDESTVRKKLKEYVEEGIILQEKQGRRVLYRRSPDTPLPATHDWLDFCSEILPCGVIGTLEIKYADGRTEIIPTDTSWMVVPEKPADWSTVNMNALTEHAFVVSGLHSGKWFNAWGDNLLIQ